MNVDYIALSVPIFFVMIAIELGYDIYKKKKSYRLNDAISNLSQGVGQQLIGVFMKTALFAGYHYLYEHARLWDIPNNIWTWIILFIGVDFFYYWFHRMSHEINALWAAHIVHHQSEEYNLTVALRQSWFQGWFSWIFYLPLAIIGFEPVMFISMVAINTLYQFWIHTQYIRNLGFLEYIINTPSHHRVHHGTNHKYIDKNHGGTLIIWDILFGTFQKEEESVTYGITQPLNSWNPIWANVHHWKYMIQLASQTPKFYDKCKVFWGPPGWTPPHVSIASNTFDPTQKYDQPTPILFSIYSVIHFVVALITGTIVLNNHMHIPNAYNILLSLYVFSSLVTCGAIFEASKWFTQYEYLRLSTTIILVFLLGPQLLSTGIIFGIIIFHFLSILYIYILSKKSYAK